MADPVLGLREVRRLLRPDARLILFEHVLSCNPPFSVILRAMNLVSSGSGLTRDTVSNALAAGIAPLSHTNIIMDIVKGIEFGPASPSRFRAREQDHVRDREHAATLHPGQR